MLFNNFFVWINITLIFLVIIGTIFIDTVI